jgi:hypothetical protein
VARIRLNVISVDDRQIVDARGAVARLPFLRLTAILFLGSHPQPTDGLIDTGSPVSVWPEKTWKPHARNIEWVTFPPGQQTPVWWTSVSGVTGGAYPCRLGRMVVTAADLTGQRLAPVPVLGKFASDGGKLPRIILGLHGGILESRRLILEADLGQA